MAARANVYCTSMVALGVCLYRSPLWARHSAYKDSCWNKLCYLCFHSDLPQFVVLPSGHFPLSPLVMSCGMPVPPVNGSVVGQDFSLGARATYRCNPGFQLAGPVTTSVTCQESGRWSPIEAQPRCVREYFSYYSISIWTFSQIRYTNVIFDVKPAPNGVDVWFNFVCLSSDHPAVTCPDIGHSAVEHGRWRLIYGTQNQYDAIMMLICDPGYYYRGQRVIRCQANSTWNYPDPRPVCDSESTLHIPWFNLSTVS